MGRRLVIGFVACVTALVAIAVLAGGVGDALRSGDSQTTGYPFELASMVDSPGAAALMDPALRDTNWSRVDSVESIRPLPSRAKSDRPAFYDDGSGCQVYAGDAVPKICESGDVLADKSLMLVGDSKIGQWQTAFSNLGKQEGWKVLTATKSACPFADAMTTVSGKVREDCRAWGRSVLQEILDADPDVVVTSQVHDKALPPGTGDGDDRTQEAMIGGLRNYWKILQDHGIHVAVLLDNPMPTTHPVYRCVEDNPSQLSRCSFALQVPLAESAAPMQRRSVAGSDATLIDMTPVICPGGVTCPAVIGNVLVYRAGSHLTKSFVVSAQKQLAEQLSRATAGEFGSQNGAKQ